MSKRNRPGPAGGGADTGIGHMGVEGELLRKAQLETIGAVASVLGHESRNLLGALGTCVQILRRNPHISDDDRELLDIIQSGSRRLEEVVSEFATFANPGVPRLRPVDLHGLIDETLTRLANDDRFSAALVVNRRFDAAVDKVQGDREQLGQVLWHLCLNAGEALGDRGQLEVETHAEGETVQITVRDSGQGIPAADLPSIFEPLYSTKSRGAGLGLAIVRRIVETHGGQVSAQSDPGTGTSFVVLLPVGSGENSGRNERKR